MVVGARSAIVYKCKNGLAGKKIKTTTFKGLNNKPVICQQCKKPVWSLNMKRHYELEHSGKAVKPKDKEIMKSGQEFCTTVKKRLARHMGTKRKGKAATGSRKKAKKAK